jgi:hypothetical protein
MGDEFNLVQTLGANLCLCYVPKNNVMKRFQDSSFFYALLDISPLYRLFMLRLHAQYIQQLPGFSGVGKKKERKKEEGDMDAYYVNTLYL